MLRRIPALLNACALLGSLACLLPWVRVDVHDDKGVLLSTQEITAIRGLVLGEEDFAQPGRQALVPPLVLFAYAVAAIALGRSRSRRFSVLGLLTGLLVLVWTGWYLTLFGPASTSSSEPLAQVAVEALNRQLRRTPGSGPYVAMAAGALLALLGAWGVGTPIPRTLEETAKP